MRKLFEAIQAYRRLHNGEYPDTTVTLGKLGLVPEDLLICPSYLEGRPQTGGAQGTWRSSGEQLDPNYAYQYELAPKSIPAGFLPEGSNANWKQIKTLLISRPGWEQVPVIRCERHSQSGERLNLTFTGQTYVSGKNWEEGFVDTVPLTYRSPYFTLTRNVPPFVDPKSQPKRIPGAISLASACNSLPEDPWWWGGILGYDGVPVATLKPLLDASVEGCLRLEDQEFDVRYLVQVQGAKLSAKGDKEGFVHRCFPRTITIPVNQTAREATILSGTVWRTMPGEPVGKLVWRLSDGTTEETPLIYGRNTGRFYESAGSSGATPYWQGTAANRQLFLFATRWTNPRPEVPIESIVFSADPGSLASPFLASIRTEPRTSE